MKSSKILAIALLTLFLCVPFSFAKRVVKIGVVDMRKVFRESKMAQKLANDFFKEVQTKKRQVILKEKQLKSKEKKFKKEAKSLSKTEKAKKLRTLRQEAKELKNMKNDIEDQLRTKRQRIRIKIMTQIRNIINDYAKKYGYTIILPKGMLLYSQDTVDITDNIIKELNKLKK